MNTTPILELAVAAAGGLERWQEVREVKAKYSAGGLAFNSRLRGSTRHQTVTVTPNELRAVFTPYPSSGHRGVFEGTGVRIETEDGHVVQRRENAREVCVSHKFRWDDLDLLYFKGYAQWSYLTEPFCLLMPGLEFKEAEPGREGTETWRKLDVIFPSGFPTHSRAQSFYFDEKGDLRRHDYFADVFGGKASAHYCERYREYSGLRVATRRRVYPKAANGRPRRFITVVWVDLEAFEVVT